VLTGRAYAVVGGALLIWVASRVVGAHDLHMVAVGLLALVPMSFALVRLTRHDLRATRRLSARRGFPGTRVRVDVELQNRGRARTSFLLLEDRLAPGLGPPARAVVSGIPAGGRETVSYEITCRSRGRYLVGPLSASVADPFDMARYRVQFKDRHELIVYPEVEQLEAVHLAVPIGGSGESATRQLFRTGEDFYTMRQYELGDDLRRIHWPSVARTGELMIRQDEAARRAAAALFLDTRSAAIGHPDAFERAVSAAASIGMLHLRNGFSLRLGTPDLAPRTVGGDQFLEALALVSPSSERVLTPSLRRLGELGSGGPSLIVVTHAPTGEEVTALLRAGASYGPRLAVFVYQRDPDQMYLPQRTELDRRVDAARRSLIRAGWDVLLLRPDGRLGEIWDRRRRRPAERTAAFS
jgi:uncharacterized protein (DUF58 family)